MYIYYTCKKVIVVTKTAPGLFFLILKLPLRASLDKKGNSSSASNQTYLVLCWLVTIWCDARAEGIVKLAGWLIWLNYLMPTLAAGSVLRWVNLASLVTLLVSFFWSSKHSCCGWLSLRFTCLNMASGRKYIFLRICTLFRKLNAEGAVLKLFPSIS